MTTMMIRRRKPKQALRKVRMKDLMKTILTSVMIPPILMMIKKKILRPLITKLKNLTTKNKKQTRKSQKTKIPLRRKLKTGLML